jgi:hypothetical protein
MGSALALRFFIIHAGAIEVTGGAHGKKEFCANEPGFEVQ